MRKTQTKEMLILRPFSNWIVRQGQPLCRQVEQDILLVYHAFDDGATVPMLLVGQGAALRLRDLATAAGFEKAAQFYQQDYECFCWLLSQQV